jgi:hypothetical protein
VNFAFVRVLYDCGVFVVNSWRLYINLKSGRDAFYLILYLPSRSENLAEIPGWPADRNPIDTIYVFVAKRIGCQTK